MDLYSENILYHYRHPHHAQRLQNPNVSFSDSNPLCGDKITIDLIIQNGIITDVGFSGEGCAISQAAASMLMDEISGKTLLEVEKMTNEDIFKMIGVPLSSARVKCGLLAFAAMKKGIRLQKLG